jgi:cysteine synthase
MPEAATTLTTRLTAKFMINQRWKFWKIEGLIDIITGIGTGGHITGVLQKF